MTLEQFSVVFLIFTRFSALVAVLPFFSWRGIPVLTKIGFAALLAWLLYLTGSPQVTLPSHFLLYVSAVLSEVLLGLALGFLVLMVFTAARIAGQLVDLQSGLMMSSVFDPQYGGQVTIFGHFYYLFALVFYLSVNGHHQLLAGLAGSLKLVPPGGAVFQAALIPEFTRLIYQMFMIAFQLAVPVVAVLIFSDLALGLLSKTVPQLHVFMIGMPLKVGVGLFIIYLIFPYFAQVLEMVFARMQNEMMQLFRLL